MRRGDELLEAIGGERGDLGERLARDQLGRELAGDRDGKLDRLGLEPRLRSPRARCASRSSASPICSNAIAVRRSASATRFLLGGGEAVAEALALGLGELEGVLGRADRAAPLRWRPARSPRRTGICSAAVI